jgi:site-specific DNA recombinase
LHHGPIWWGHRKVYDTRTGEPTIEVDPVNGPSAEEVVTRLLASESESGLAREFAERGIPCPQEQKWTAVHVRKIHDAARDPQSWAKLATRWTPEQLEASLEVLMLVKERESPSAIARHMNVEQYPHALPGEWDAAKIRCKALNPALAGLRVHQGEIIGDAVWKHVITPEQHYQLVAKLGDPSRVTNKDGTRVKHLLTGIMPCDVCEKGVRIRLLDWGPAYRCAAGHVLRHQDLTDAYVVEAVLSRLESPDANELFRTRPDDAEEVRHAVSEAKELRARLEGFTDKAADGGISPAAFARIEAKLVRKIEAAERRVREIGMTPLLAEVVGPQARTVWAGLSIGQQRDVLRAIVRPRLKRTVGGPWRVRTGVDRTDVALARTSCASPCRSELINSNDGPGLLCGDRGRRGLAVGLPVQLVHHRGKDVGQGFEGSGVSSCPSGRRSFSRARARTPGPAHLPDSSRVTTFVRLMPTSCSTHWPARRPGTAICQPASGCAPWGSLAQLTASRPW